MPRSILICRSLLVAALFSLAAAVASAEQVNYHGALTLNGQPVVFGYVIAGTFKATFDPSRYKYEYGMDDWGNMGSPNLTKAIADGNFLPIGSGDFTEFDGSFSSFGFHDGDLGRQIYLFAFSDPEADLADHFALASNPNWLTSPTSITIDGANASQYIFGKKAGTRIDLQGLPIPEPAAAAVIGTALGAVGMRRRRHLSRPLAVNGRRARCES